MSTLVRLEVLTDVGEPDPGENVSFLVSKTDQLPEFPDFDGLFNTAKAEVKMFAEICRGKGNHYVELKVPSKSVRYFDLHIIWIASENIWIAIKFRNYSADSSMCVIYTAIPKREGEVYSLNTEAKELLELYYNELKQLAAKNNIEIKRP